MKTLTIKKQLFLFAVFMLALQAAIAFVGYNSLQGLRDNLYSVFKKRLPSIDNLVQADRDFQQALVAERTLLIEGLTPEERAAWAKDYAKNRKQVSERFEEYRNLADSPEEKKLIEAFDANLDQWHKSSDRLLNLDASGTFQASSDNAILTQNSLGEVSSKFENSRTQLDMLQEQILGMGAKEFDKAVSQYQSAEKFIIFFTGFGLAVSLFVSWFMAKRVSGKIERIAMDLGEHNLSLNSISGDLEQKSGSLAEVSQEQAASVTETSSSLHEISQMVKNNSSNSEKSAGLVKESEVLIQRGIEVVNELKANIQNVEKCSDEMMESVDRNNQDLSLIFSVFEEIKNKTNVINDIVFQTKLLSFNASVEAARAGEHGKGFSVVAEEIGNLAQESGSSAHEITELLEGSLAKVSAVIQKSKQELDQSVQSSKDQIVKSVDSSERCQHAFEEISGKFSFVAEAANEVVSASREQESGVEEINKAMQEIDSSNGITSESANTIAHSSNQLSHLVKSITDNIHGLEALVGLKESRGESVKRSSSSTQASARKSHIESAPKKAHKPVELVRKQEAPSKASPSFEDEWVDLESYDDDFSKGA